MQTPIQHL